MKLNLFITMGIVCSFFSKNLYANSETDIESFFDDLNEYVTESNLNIDHQPSVLTVLYAKDLKSLGATTLSEALGYVPGVESIDTTVGRRFLLLRGNAPISSSTTEKIKYFIDGVDIDSYYYADFPIELIDRIEILRGGVSAIYGQGALIGAVNIITKSSDLESNNNLNISAGSYDNRKASALVSQTIGTWHLGLDTYYQKHNKKVDAPSGKPISVISLGSYSRENESLEGMESKGFGLILKKDNFKFKSRYIDLYKQNNYGAYSYIDHNDDGYSTFNTTYGELTYFDDISKYLSFDIKAGVVKNTIAQDSYFYKLEPITVFGIKIYDPHYKFKYSDLTRYSDLSFDIKKIDNHKIKVGAYVGRVSSLTNEYYSNFDVIGKVGLKVSDTLYFPVTNQLTKLDGSQGVINDPGRQSLNSYYLQDIYSFSSNLNISFNMRVDDYEFFDKAESYRLAGVYSKDNVNIYKLIVSRASNIPTLTQTFLNNHIGLSGNRNLDAETIDIIELAYIYTQDNDRFKLNTYYSKHKDTIFMLQNNDQFVYINNPDDQINFGLELEYLKTFKDRSSLILNGSYTEYRYKYGTTEIDTPIASKQTVNASYVYPLNSLLTWSNGVRFYGDRRTFSNESINRVSLVDTTLEYKIKDDIDITFGGRNIFDKTYYYHGTNTNDEKMLREGAVYFANLNYEF